MSLTGICHNAWCFHGLLKEPTVIMDITKRKSHELKKHVGAIHSANSLTLLQRKIANALLFNAYQDLQRKEQHAIHINDLCQLIGYDSKDYKTIRQSLVNLLATVIEWNLIDRSKDQDQSVWNASSIIADASIDGPICSYSYSRKMRELLYRPELYGKLNMLIQAKFKSNYGLALYENCVRYISIAQSPWFDLGTFRKLMGVEKSKYPIFRDFKRRVLDKAIAEVNEYSNISLEVQLKREKRKVTAIKFRIHKKQLLPEQQEQVQPLLSTRLQNDFGLSVEKAEQLMQQYSDDYILQKIALVEQSSSYQEGRIQNLAMYLQRALEEDYQQPKSSKEIIMRQQTIKKSKQVAKVKQLEAQQNKRFEQDKQIMAIYKNLSSRQQAKIDKEFLRHLNGSLYANIFERDGFKNILVGEQFCSFIRHEHAEWLAEVGENV